MPRRPSFTFDITGIDGLVEQLAQFGSKTTAKRILRGSMNKAGTQLAKAARRNVPRDTGTLKKSITKSVRTKGASMVAVIGPDPSKSGTDEHGNRRLPNSYAHLVEYGHRDADTGRDIPGARFIGKARDQEGPKVSGTFQSEVGQRISKELAKGRKR
ncbi:MAG: HK97-gp10 family putative phage morphogenesis protein [Planctomycetota bacterium]